MSQRPTELGKLRDYLLPGVWAFASRLSPDKRWDLEIDHSNDCINLVSDKGDRSQIVSRSDILDNVYPGEFGSRMIEIMRNK